MPIDAAHRRAMPVRRGAIAIAAALAALVLALPAGARERVVLTGAVEAVDTQPIHAPPSNGPVVLRYYVPDGSEVVPGDVLVRTDPGQSLAQIRTLETQVEQARAKADKEIAELEVKAVDAEVALVDAWAALEKARVDAAVPQQHVSALDYDRYQGELLRTQTEHALKQRELEAARDAVVRRRADAALEVAKLEAERQYHEAQVANAEVRAERAGVVVHGFDSWRGQRIDEGATTGPGRRVGDVVGPGPMRVTAWALEADRAPLAVGQRARLVFDAYPGQVLEGRIERIAAAPDAKAEWGAGRWFELHVAMPPDGDAPPLKPGMSVRVEVPLGGTTAVAP